MGTHLIVLGESFPMNTNMAGIKGFQKFQEICAFGENSLSIERVNPYAAGGYCGPYKMMQKKTEKWL